MLTKGLQSHDFRCCIIHLNGDNVKVRIEALACSDCLLSCLSNVTQNVPLLMTIRADMFAVEIELSLFNHRGKMRMKWNLCSKERVQHPPRTFGSRVR